MGRQNYSEIVPSKTKSAGPVSVTLRKPRCGCFKPNLERISTADLHANRRWRTCAKMVKQGRGAHARAASERFAFDAPLVGANRN